MKSTHLRVFARPLIVCIAALLWLQFAHAQVNPCDFPPQAQDHYLKASNVGAQDQFGYSLAASGNFLVVGAPNEDSSGAPSDNSAADAGAAYVFERNGNSWTEVAYLKASDADAGDLFGYDVDISGDTIAVGAYKADTATVDGGCVYIFQRNGNGVWQEDSILHGSSVGTRFGYSVALQGDTLLVGATSHGANARGLAYVFGRDSIGTWSEWTTLSASNWGVFDGFGSDVAVDGSVAVVSAIWEDSSASGVNGDGTLNDSDRSGAAYVFRGSLGSWVQEAYLKAGVNQESAFFGQSVSVSGGRVVVGAVNEEIQPPGSSPIPGAGKAYVYDYTQGAWALTYSLTGFPEQAAKFGHAVDITAQGILIGANGESSIEAINCGYLDNQQGISGGCYLFTNNGVGEPTLQKYFKSIEPVVDHNPVNDWLGWDVALDNGNAYAGARLEDAEPNTIANSGAVYVFAANFPTTKQDLSGDGYMDFVVQNQDSWGIRFMQDTVHLGTTLGQPLPAGAKIHLFGDVAGAAEPDIVYITEGRDIIIQEIDQNVNFSGPPKRVSSLSLGWSLRACGDFNDDGDQDFVFQHDDGRLSIWFLVNGVFAGHTTFNQDMQDDPLYRLAAIDDYNSDGYEDLVFQHRDGDYKIWRMTGLARVGSISFNFNDMTQCPKGKIVAGGDANLDGSPDLCFQFWDGRLRLWYLENGSRVMSLPSAFLPDDFTSDPTWRIRNSGWHSRTSRFDWDNDGWTDIFFQGDDGRLAIWKFAADQYLGGQVLSDAQPIPNTIVVGHTDIDGDCHEDIIWQAPAGAISIWRMNGITKLEELNGPVVDASWRIVGFNDLNKDGLDDWIFQNQGDGRCVVWYMNGLAFQGWDWVQSPSGTDWHLSAVIDMNCDGDPDLIWRNISTGGIAVWHLDGITLVSGEFTPSPTSLRWELDSVHDVDRDGYADFVFRNQATGQIVTWLMERTTYLGFFDMGSTSSFWKIRH